MTFHLFEGDVRNDAYAADSVIGVVRRIADLHELGSVENQFAGDLIVYDDQSWQRLLDEYRYDDEDPDGLERFLDSAGVPVNIPDGKLLLQVSAYNLEGPIERGARDVYRLIPSDPVAFEIERVLDLVLPEYGYRIRDDGF